MRNLITLFSLLFCIQSCAVSPKTEVIAHPDAGFKYVTRMDRPNPTNQDNLERYMASLPKDVYENRKLRNHYISQFKVFNDISMEVYLYISDAYTYINGIDSLVDKVEIPPRFKNGDEKKFSKWILKKNDIKFPPDLTILDPDYRGNIVMEVTIGKDGSLTHKVLGTRITSEDEYIPEQLAALFTKSPRWKPGMDNGEVVDAKYLVSLVWGHYRVVGQSGKQKLIDISGKVTYR
ncbi:MAG: energy transducer TonB [Rikenellaceae bacterium]|nr:energy transducer TonB [Rikenellaceae bacterium]